jgi:FixJ family two-component response regulator
MIGERLEKVVTVIEDDDSYRAAVQRLLNSAGFSVESFNSAEAFLNSGRQHDTGCLITDIRMPGMSGLELQSKLNSDRCSIPTIFITAHGDEKLRLQAMRGGAVKFLLMFGHSALYKSRCRILFVFDRYDVTTE